MNSYSSFTVSIFTNFSEHLRATTSNFPQGGFILDDYLYRENSFLARKFLLPPCIIFKNRILTRIWSIIRLISICPMCTCSSRKTNPRLRTNLYVSRVTGQSYLHCTNTTLLHVSDLDPRPYFLQINSPCTHYFNEPVEDALFSAPSYF